MCRSVVERRQYPGWCCDWLVWVTGLLLGLSHEMELLLTDGTHTRKALVWHHQLAVAVS